jgi:hypothetical protein
MNDPTVVNIGGTFRARVLSFTKAVNRVSNGERWQPEAGRDISPLPYPGLRYFNAEPGQVFVGRESQAARVIDRLGGSQVVLILGGSGCGKSSLIRGGVLLKLSGTMPVPGRDGAWYAVTFRPERDPIRQLIDEFDRAVLRPFLGKIGVNHSTLVADLQEWEAKPAVELAEIHARREALQKKIDELTATASGARRAGRELWQEISRLSEELRKIGAPARVRERIEAIKTSTPGQFTIIFDDAAPPDAIGEAAATAAAEAIVAPENAGFEKLRLFVEALDRALAEDPSAPGANLLIVVDQFEEVFRKEVNPDSRRRLMGLVRHVYDHKPRGVFLALVMRSEDLHHCAEEPELPDIVNTSSMFVDWLDSEQLKRAIVEPAQRVLLSWLDEPPPKDDPTFPFAEEVVSTLLEETEQLKQGKAVGGLEQRSDHLPLLQHGLQVLWRYAIDDWRVKATAAPALRSSDLLLRDLEIDAGTLGRAVAEAKKLVEQAEGSRRRQAGDRSALQWLLAGAAEATLQKAEETYLDRAPAGAPKSAALRAAFCEMASIDENSRYYRAFRRPDEIVRKRLRLDDRHMDDELSKEEIELVGALDNALDEFEKRGLLSSARLRRRALDGESEHNVARDVTHEALLRNWPCVARWVADDERAQKAMSKALDEGRVAGWDQAKALEPVLGPWRPTPIYPMAWMLAIAEGKTKTGFSSRTLGRLKLSYFWARWQTPLLCSIVLLVVMLGGGTFLYLDAVNKRDKEFELRTELMTADTIASNLASKQMHGQSVRQRARELLAAYIVWRKAKQHLGQLETISDLQAGIANDLRFTESDVDSAARDLLGSTFSVGKLPSLPAAAITFGSHCGDTTSDKLITAVGLNGSTRTVRIEPIRLPGSQDVEFFGLSVGGSQTQTPESALPPYIYKGSRVCLSDDGDILVVSQPGDVFPEIYVLNWHKGTADASEDSEATPTKVEPPGRLQFDLPLSAPGLQQMPTVTGVSDRLREQNSFYGADARLIKFRWPNSTDEFVATFYEGYTRPFRHLGTVSLNFENCKSEEKSSNSSSNASPTPSCGADFSGMAQLDRPHVRSDHAAPPEGPSSDAIQVYFGFVTAQPGWMDSWLRQLERMLHSLLERLRLADSSAITDQEIPMSRIQVVQFAPPIKSVGFEYKSEGHSYLYLEDTGSEVWKLALVDQSSLDIIKSMAELGSQSTEQPSLRCQVKHCDELLTEEDTISTSGDARTTFERYLTNFGDLVVRARRYMGLQ